MHVRRVFHIFRQLRAFRGAPHIGVSWISYLRVLKRKGFLASEELKKKVL